MLEKIREVPFIDESSAVKVCSVDGKTVLERNDRVVWASESTELASENINCYVEADKFFSLLPDIKTLKQETALEVTLKNGAVYKLPYLSVAWDAVEMPEEYEDTITFKLSDLMLCTLKNLVKPELQCILIDQDGAVTCDFISSCISKEVRASKRFLLPPDVQDLVNGRLCKVLVTDDKIFIKANDFSIVTSRPTMSEDEWWNDLRGMVSGETRRVFAGDKLAESLKRLALFNDYVTFDGVAVRAGSNFEPYEFEVLGAAEFEIEKLARILTTASKVSQVNGNLVLSNDSSIFLISPEEGA